jgi:PDZ domain-containing protein
MLVVIAVGGLFIRLPYDTVAPGSTRQVNDLIVVKGHAAYPPRGKVLFTTVAVRERVNLWQAVGGLLDHDVEVVKDSDLRGAVPPSQFQQLNVEAMADSKVSAEAVVLQRLGFSDLSVGAEVEAVEPSLPAASVLKPKDLVTAVDGKPVKNPSDLVAGIRSHHPGDSVRLAVSSGGAPPADRTVAVGRGDQGQALLGVSLGVKIKLPFDIAIDSGNVEGPSAGLAYSLALLDELTPGELTGGSSVAATGEIGPDGKVAAIGGVAQKVVTVQRSGARMFLVPRANYAEARAQASKNLDVRPVDTFDDAVRALASLPGSDAGSYLAPGNGGA